jgi:dCMP deaminase
MELAMQERRNSDDPKVASVPQSAVGAVIARGERVISASANVLPPKLKQARLAAHRPLLAEERYFVIEHAERAAIYSALASGRSLRGTTMYCTRFPCSDCARSIIWAGIGRLVVFGGFGGESIWIGSQRAALQMLRDAGLTIRYAKVGATRPDLIPDSRTVTSSRD